MLVISPKMRSRKHQEQISTWERCKKRIVADAVLSWMLWCVAQTPTSGLCLIPHSQLPSLLVAHGSQPSYIQGHAFRQRKPTDNDRLMRAQKDPCRSTLNGHFSFGLRFCCNCKTSCSQSCLFHPSQMLTPGHSSIHFVHTNLYFRVCFLSNLT